MYPNQTKVKDPSRPNSGQIKVKFRDWTRTCVFEKVKDPAEVFLHIQHKVELLKTAKTDLTFSDFGMAVE